ncbi:MAG: L-2-hydroxyglutarate oxidase [Planctomycetota bacterium]
MTADAPNTTERADLVVVGGGIVGLATAHRFLERHPGKSVIVLEKEDRVAAHQTGHNSGVIHSGIYYKPGSLKALNCRRGLEMLEAFADEHDIARERCGKVIVALDDDEAARLDGLCERGIANGVTCRVISAEELREFEPACAGVRAIRVEDTGIIDYGLVCRTYARLIEERGGSVVTSARVADVDVGHTEVAVRTNSGCEFFGEQLANCAGLQSDRVTGMSGAKSPVKIVPFRGEYFELTPGARHLCRDLIYPVPDPAFPFLGVHFTRMITSDEHGHHVECGPNAVLAFAREGYTRTTIDWGDLAETLSYPAFWKIALKHWRTGAGEMFRSFSKRAFVRALQRLIPDITEDDLVEVPAGVRAQALAPDGTLLDDFSIVQSERVINVCNAPSPAATASLAIGDSVVGRLEQVALGTSRGMHT